MAKINHLEMTENLMALNDIEVKKGFMGWSIKLIYKPTNSVLKVKEQEYTVSFKDFSYQPVTEMKVYTGKTAEAFVKLF